METSIIRLKNNDKDTVVVTVVHAENLGCNISDQELMDTVTASVEALQKRKRQELTKLFDA